MKLRLPSLPLLMAILVAATSITLGGCSSSRRASHKPPKPDTHHPKPKKPQQPGPRYISLEGLSGSERTLVSEARQWLGTPYKYGGNSRDGVDCSGFVYNVYRNSLDISLPRNSARQQEYCTKVKRDDLATGDLVFFATNKGSRGVSHVGLYVGDGMMIHASTRKGVIVQDLSDEYYTKTYVGAGRVSEFASLNRPTKQKAKPSASPASPEKTEAPVTPEQPSPAIRDDSPEPPSSPSPNEAPTVTPSSPTSPTAPPAPESSISPAENIPSAVKIVASSPSSDSPGDTPADDARSRVLSSLPDLQ